MSHFVEYLTVDSLRFGLFLSHANISLHNWSHEISHRNFIRYLSPTIFFGLLELEFLFLTKHILFDLCWDKFWTSFKVVGFCTIALLKWLFVYIFFE